MYIGDTPASEHIYEHAQVMDEYEKINRSSQVQLPLPQTVTVTGVLVIL